MTIGLNWQAFVYLTRRGITDVTAWRHAIDASSAPEPAVIIAALDALERADEGGLEALARVILGLVDNAYSFMDYALESRREQESDCIVVFTDSDQSPSPAVSSALDDVRQPVNFS